MTHIRHSQHQASVWQTGTKKGKQSKSTGAEVQADAQPKQSQLQANPETWLSTGSQSLADVNKQLLLAQDASQVATWNSSQGMEAWVKTLYNNILGRDPENQAVVDGWVKAANLKGTTSVVQSFFDSPEFKSQNLSPEDQVERLYRSILNRPAEAEGKADWVKTLKDGLPLDYLVSSFVNSDEYKQHVTAGKAPDDPKAIINKWQPSSGLTGWATTLYQNILQREPESQAVVDNWAKAAQSGGIAPVLKAFFKSTELQSKKLSSEETVDLLYESILNRPAEPTGKAGWVAALNSGMSVDTMIDKFLTSTEYQAHVAKGTAPTV